MCNYDWAQSGNKFFFSSTFFSFNFLLWNGKVLRYKKNWIAFNTARQRSKLIWVPAKRGGDFLISNFFFISFVYYKLRAGANELEKFLTSLATTHTHTHFRSLSLYLLRVQITRSLICYYGLDISDLNDCSFYCRKR